ncbi:chemotaxis protein CheW [Xanthomonas campestris]|uniref:chemotaxis protein CheW n=1 Tax=Xanthomonas campestris TaxID=339 RepID=UPI001EEF34F7|nr:chemotaxis protein CheW [Xanthomonas campestris]MCF8796109.1 chemotaxis protein CheW [Xanthomonas campestris pv. campestris]MCF8813210.1 chemotaxis protein CheW [Xanthomonas campestris pv. campestris]MDO0837546.1 chemotaxis protein CheW [Xanthomonas campestris pv. campestris]WHO87240.1 chemotaxis protein CheW [Xanthomonas campestris]WHO91060.1 chemotaxis protein CheW [Xanthomonas campestris]
MSNHTANGELDDYLEGLLHDAGVEIDVATVTVVTSAAPVAAEADLAQADDLALAEPPVQATAAPQVSAPVLSAEAIAADFLAEMDADPAFGPPVVSAPSADDIAADFLAEMDADPAFGPPVAAAPSAADIAADFLAEMDADPAFATAAPSPFMSTADLMAEMDADPAFASAEPSADMIAADLLAELDSDPAFGLDAAPVAVPAPARPAPAPARAAPAPVYPQGLQALLAPGQAEHIHAERRASERSTRWLRLRCGEQTYALELLKVQEVVLPVPLLPLRGTPSAMLGIMNLRGQVVPVIDLGIHLGSSPVDMDLHTRVVVLEENGETMGLRVSAVEDVTSLTDHQIEPPDNARLCRISNNLFRGVARLGHHPMILLDATHLLH